MSAHKKWKHSSKIKVVNKVKHHPYYTYWRGMLNRCKEGGKEQEIHPSYIGCSVCDEWQSYDNFFEWCVANYYVIPGHRMQLDKDILIKGNKTYSPETCVFTPNNINTIFTYKKSHSKGLPPGVFYRNDLEKYQSQITIKGKHRHLGYFSTPEEAFSAYKQAKEEYIKQVADEYKGLMPQRLYEAMYTYKVEITD